MQTIPHQNITGLYRRFLRFTTAVKHSTLPSYSHRYQLTYGFPPILAEILPVSRLNVSSQSFSLSPFSPGMGSNSASFKSSLHNQHLFTSDHLFLSNWNNLKTMLVNSLSRSVPVIFRHTMINPAHPVYYQSMQFHGPEGNYAKPLTIAYLYQLGLRTLYFLERAAGLRPYVSYVEYLELPSITSTLHPTNFHLSHSSQLHNHLSKQTRISTSQPTNIIQSNSRNYTTATHSMPNQNRLNTTINQNILLSPSEHYSTSPSLSRPRSSLLNKVFLRHNKHEAEKNNIFYSYRHFLPSASAIQYIKHPKSTPNTSTSQYIYTLIQENRQRPIHRIIPLSTHPQSIQLLPPETQLIIFKIHEYFKQIEQQFGGIPLTDQQKAEILSQLSPQIQDVLCNRFVINNNHRLEERLLQLITKGGYFNLGVQSTVPIIIQRHQLINLLKELQLIIF